MEHLNPNKRTDIGSKAPNPSGFAQPLILGEKRGIEVRKVGAYHVWPSIAELRRNRFWRKLKFEFWRNEWDELREIWVLESRGDELRDEGRDDRRTLRNNIITYLVRCRPTRYIKIYNI